MEADRYEVLEKIGQGSFGIIRKVRRKSDGHILCRKEISYTRMSTKEREQLQAELSILKGLRHPNIVAYFEREHIKASGDLHIYMEYCEQGDLGMRIKELRRTGQMASEDFVWSVFAQLVTALYRCHYGEDSPEVSGNVLGLASDAKPARISGGRNNHMILHRDLKPENIFLGADASVKLGDFGLSKIMASNDFASTYVGTPFYMSPEICAAEQYSLHSDIWAFGCIMYELCAKAPPFNAKTHLELIQKIRIGKVDSLLSSCYSQDLKDAINKCLRVNPTTRPDTVQLLNLPMVKLKRKEQEVVRISQMVKAKEDRIAKMQQDLERKLRSLEADKDIMRSEIDNSLRREWEVKARLEIDRQVQLTTQQLYESFESEVNRRVEEQVKLHELRQRPEPRSSTPDPQDLPPNVETYGYQRSQSTLGESDDFPSSTDLSELSLESPTLEKSTKPSKRSSRTPFGRAHTMFEGSPMDVQMADPSPAPIASLGLSPRQDSRHRFRPSALSRNLFAAKDIERISSTPNDSEEDPNVLEEDDEDLDEFLPLPSPTRRKGTSGDPFKLPGFQRPGLPRQKTAPQKTASQPSLFTSRKENVPPESTAGQVLLPKTGNSQGLTKSPSRRISKLPSASNVFNTDSTSPMRKHSGTSKAQYAGGAVPRPVSRKKDEGFAQGSGMLQGRTLLELHQARTAVQDFAGGERPKEAKYAAPVWDPERDEMPSPFIKRSSHHNVLPPALGGPGMRHLR